MRCEMGTKVTLKQIAEQAGVSLTTVHRVLNGKEGCGQEVRDRILRIAKEEGYKVNVTASSLRRQTMYIALLFPRYEKRNRYFIQKILDGYIKARSDLEQYNVVFQEFYYSNTGEESDSMLTYLRRISRGEPTRFDGVILYGLGMDLHLKMDEIIVMNRLIGRLGGNGVPVMALEQVPAGSERESMLSSVAVNDALAADLASELMSKFIHGKGTVLVLNQYLPSGDKNGQFFCRQMKQMRSDLAIYSAELDLFEDQTEPIAALMEEIPDLVGVYATCARHTRSLLKARKQHPEIQTVIGSELFEESYEALQEGLLDAVIDKRPAKMGYLAVRYLFDYLTRNVPMQSVYEVTPRIVLRANSKIYYEETKENQYESSD